MEKISKISIESNDPTLEIDVNKFQFKKNNKNIAFCILLALLIILESFYIIYLSF